MAIIKAGTRVESYTIRSSKEAKKRSRIEGYLASDFDPAKHNYFNGDTTVIVEDNGNSTRVWSEGVKVIPTATQIPNATKTWIVIVTNKYGQLEPAVNPRTYATAEQARSVARSMAEKHTGSTFLVFESVGAAYVAPAPKAAFVSL